jgi:hypothetical protein
MLASEEPVSEPLNSSSDRDPDEYDDSGDPPNTPEDENGKDCQEDHVQDALEDHWAFLVGAVEVEPTPEGGDDKSEDKGEWWALAAN